MIEYLVLETIEQIFSSNLRRYRGKRTQAQLAEAAGIPLRTYQTYEAGVVPQEGNRTAVANALGVPETHLFVDREAFVPRDQISIQDGLAELFEKFPKLDHPAREIVLKAARREFAKIKSQPDRNVDSDE